jgi:hypothetical protein
MIARMRMRLGTVWLLGLAPAASLAQCAPGPDSAYFFRNLSEQRAQARIDGDRKVYEAQLSASFAAHAADGRPLSREAFIDAELRGEPAARGRTFSISNYTLVEHRKGHTVATYLLREDVGSQGGVRPRELQLTEVYEVVDSQWRLTTVDVKPAAPPRRPTGAAL